MAVTKNSLGGLSGTNKGLRTGASTTKPTPYVRPSDWLALPTVNVGDQKIVMLVAVYPGDSNFIGFTTGLSAGNCTYNWGDGTANTVVGSGIAVSHTFAYASLPGTECSRGYRQAVVTITPVTGNLLNFTTITPTSGPSIGVNHLILDFKIASSTMAGNGGLAFSTGGGTNNTCPMLEQFEYVGPSAITSGPNLFQGAKALRNVIGTTWTANMTSVPSMFQNCYSLQTIPLLDTGNATSFASMFSGCFSLVSVPLLNTVKSTSFISMFQGCSSLVAVPLLNTAASAQFGSMFQGCASLQSVPLFNLGAATSLVSMFLSCSSLTSAPLFNLGAGVSFQSMFNGCAALQTVPLFDTHSGTTFTSMFSGCSSLQTVPLLNTSSATTFTTMFQNCVSLRTVPQFDLSKAIDVSSMFIGCTALTAVPAFTIGGATGAISLNSMFSGCTALTSVGAPVITTTGAITVANMFVSCASLTTVPLFNTSTATTIATMFSGCASLETIPAFNVVAAITLTTPFASCVNLQVAVLQNIRGSISYATLKLSGAQLDAIYTALPPANLLSVDAASMETSINDWNANLVNCTATRQTGVQTVDGSANLKITRSAGTSQTAGITARIAVTAGTTYTFLASVSSPSVNTLANGVNIGWYDSGGALLSTTIGSTIFQFAGNTWNQVSASAVAPVGAVTASLILVSTLTSAGNTFWDAMGFFIGAATLWTSGVPSITVTGNWGIATDTPSIATNKGWTVTGS